MFVDDNMRVKKGNILVQLDKEPYQIKLAIKQAAVNATQADLTAAQARIRGVVGLVRALVVSRSSVPSKTSTPRSPNYAPTSPLSRAGRRASNWRGAT